MCCDPVSYESVAADATHPAAFGPGGLVLGWFAANRFLDRHVEAEHADALARLRAGELSGPDLYRALGGRFTSDLLSAEGNRFARAEFAALREAADQALREAGEEAAYARLAPTLDARYASFRRATAAKKRRG